MAEGAEPVARRIDSRRSAAPPDRSATDEAALATFLEAAVERPRRIDAYIDYFASDRHPADRIRALRARQ